MPIGNMIPIYLHLRTIDSSTPDTPKPEKIKKFWSLIKSLKKTGLGSHHSEKMEFLPGFTCWISFAPVFSLIYC